jgi:hypothetical protein
VFVHAAGNKEPKACQWRTAQLVPTVTVSAANASKRQPLWNAHHLQTQNPAQQVTGTRFKGSPGQAAGPLPVKLPCCCDHINSRQPVEVDGALALIRNKPMLLNAHVTCMLAVLHCDDMRRCWLRCVATTCWLRGALPACLESMAVSKNSSFSSQCK